MRCELCGGACQPLGQLGRRVWLRCRSCHHETSFIDRSDELTPTDRTPQTSSPESSDRTLVEPGELWEDVDSQETDHEVTE